MNITKLQQKRILRRALLGLLVFLTAMAQNVPWLPVVYGARGFPLLPLVVAIAFYDQPVPAILYAALAGILWDISFGGYHAIYLTLIAFLCAVVMRYFLNRNFITISLLSLATAIVYFLVRWFATYAFLPGLTPLQITAPLLTESLPNLGYTMLMTPLMFFLVSLIVRRTSRRQIEIKESGA